MWSESILLAFKIKSSVHILFVTLYVRTINMLYLHFGWSLIYIKYIPPRDISMTIIIWQINNISWKRDGLSSWFNGKSDGLRNRSKQVRTPIALLRSLSGKYSWERYEPPYHSNYGLNNTPTVLLGETNLTFEGRVFKEVILELELILFRFLSMIDNTC